MPIIAAESTKRLSIITGISGMSGVFAKVEAALFMTKIIPAIYPSAMNAFKYGFLIIYTHYSKLMSWLHGSMLELKKPLTQA